MNVSRINRKSPSTIGITIIKNIPLSQCNLSPLDLWAESLDWSLTPTGRVLPGQESAVSITSNVMFEMDNRPVEGQGLWRQGIYGSRNRDGTGEKFNYKTQTLDRMQEALPLEQDSSLEVPEAMTEFEIGTVGCNDFGYVCVEFTGGDDPEPLYYFRVVGSPTAKSEDNTLVLCKEQECLSSKYKPYSNLSREMK